MLLHKHRESSSHFASFSWKWTTASSFLKVISSPLGPASALRKRPYRFVSCISIKDINRVVFIVTVF
jgi:hypothetical protein